MFRFLLASVLVFSSAWAQIFDEPVSTDGKSGPVPEPTLIEMPYEPVRLPVLGPAAVTETSTSSVDLPTPSLDLPRLTETLIDVPHVPIPIPKGGVEEVPVDYNIPQPVVEIPEPIVQKKPVYFNVPQPIIQVAEPVVRHRPILYRVPHIVQIHRPIVKHERVVYSVPKAEIKPKSAYSN